MQKARKTKSALLPDEIEIFWNYTTTNALKMEAKRYWFLCYLANGLNPKDLFLLKKKNVKRNIITFMRNKTLRTDSEQIEISIPITSALQELLNSFGYKHLQHDDYLVPILRNIETERLGTEITHAKRRINYQLSLISDELKLEEKPMLKNARHSFATMLLYTGNRELAREMLGHSSQDTTDHYLASLPIDRFIKASEKLLDFGKK
jgi:integrase